MRDDGAGAAMSLVLIIEDNDQNLELVRDILQANGTLLRILTLHGADGTFNVDSG